MPCSFCSSPNHNIRNCQCDRVFAMLQEIQTHLYYFKERPICNTLSHGEGFYHMLERFLTNELRAIAAHYKIAIKNISREMLKLLIVQKVYYGSISNDAVLIMDQIYLNYVEQRIIGIPHNDAWEIFHTDHILKTVEVRNATRNYNLRWLQVFGSNFSIESPMYYHTLNVIDNGPRSITDFFGKYITLSDLFQHIPVLFDMLMNPNLFDIGDDANTNIANIEDVVMPQKLIIKCNYESELAMTDECIICCDKMCNTKLNCNHEFCATCVRSSIEIVLQDHRKQACCPMCRAEITQVYSNNNIEIDQLSMILNA